MQPMNHYTIPAVVCDAEKLSQIAILQELGKHRIPVIALSQDPDAIGFHSKYVVKKHHTPMASFEDNYISYLIENVPRGVLYYSNDANVENLAKHKSELLENGFHMWISDERILSQVLDKYGLYRVCLQCGVSSPRTYPLEDDELSQSYMDEIGFPLIIKSSNLAGGVYRIVHTRTRFPTVYREMRELIKSKYFVHRHPRLLIQEWISQSDSTLWNFNALVRNGEIISFSMGQRVRTDIKQDGTYGSILLFGESKMNHPVLDENKRILAYLNYDGFVETEWSESPHDGGAYLYDFNPRPTGNIRWVFKSGVPMATQYYELSVNLPVRGSRGMQEGTKYYKIFYHDNDFLQAIDSPVCSARQALKILLEDLRALVNQRNNAIDILDMKDLKPTLYVCRGLYKVFFKGLLKLVLKMLLPSKWVQNSNDRLCLPFTGRNSRRNIPEVQT